MILHLLRRVREVRSQLVDIMKVQKLSVISCGYNYDVRRFGLPDSFTYLAAAAAAAKVPRSHLIVIHFLPRSSVKGSALRISTTRRA